MKINNVRGDLTDVTAKTEALTQTPKCNHRYEPQLEQSLCA